MKPGKCGEQSSFARAGGRAGSDSCAAKGRDPTQLGVAPWAAARNTSFRCWSKAFASTGLGRRAETGRHRVGRPSRVAAVRLDQCEYLFITF